MQYFLKKYGFFLLYTHIVFQKPFEGMILSAHFPERIPLLFFLFFFYN